MKNSIETKKQAWLHAVRLRTLPLALASIFAGSFLAAKGQVFRWEILILASLTTIFLQILSNLSNDYGDTIHGADHAARKGPIRAVQSGLISLSEMKKAMYFLVFLAFSSGIGLVILALQSWVLIVAFLGLGLAAIWAAISYTSGSNPYGYAGWGDISVFVFFGLLGVIGTYFLHSLQLDPLVILLGISLGSFSTTVLNINNIRDIESDQIAGKKSIPVRIGHRSAIRYNWMLIFSGNLALLIYVILTQHWGGLLAFAVVPLMLKVGFGVQKGKTSSEIDPYLKKMAISTLLWVLLFGIGLLLI